MSRSSILFMGACGAVLLCHSPSRVRTGVTGKKKARFSRAFLVLADATNRTALQDPIAGLVLADATNRTSL
jgi:hypothetical protein